MTQFVSSQDTEQELQFPDMLKVMTDEERKQYHRKKLFELSSKSVVEILQIYEPTDEQKEWVISKMKAPAQAWQRWFVGLYLTEEQKRELG